MVRKKSDEEKKLTLELSSCLFGHYRWFVAGMTIGIPVSMYKRNYWPMVTGAVAGSMADFLEAEANCRPNKEALEQCIARQQEEERKRSGGESKWALGPEWDGSGEGESNEGWGGDDAGQVWKPDNQESSGFRE